jgi:hypothetical protein
MSENLNVGVFNVLSQGASNCSKIFTDKVFTDNVDAKKEIFAVFDYISEMSPASKPPLSRKGVPLYKKNKKQVLTPDDIKKIKQLFTNPPQEHRYVVAGIRHLNSLIKIPKPDAKVSEKKPNIPPSTKEVAHLKSAEDEKKHDSPMNNFIDKIFKDEEKDKTFGTFLKFFSQLFPGEKGNGFGLYGGFKLGGEKDDVDKAMTADGMKEVFSKKREFLETKITEFFEGNGHILVCPEFDYEETFCNSNPQFKRFRDNVGEENLYKKENLTEDVPNIFLPKVNFCRSIFVRQNVTVTPITSCSREIDKVKKSKGNIEVSKGKKDTASSKQNVDVNKITFNDGKSIILISVHLDSTTSINDIDVKNEELKNLLNLTLELKKQNPSLDIIIAGDFNFPFFQTYEKIDGFESNNEDIEIDTVVFWKVFQLIFGFTSPDKVGVCTKERFHNELGNDQLWEGKSEKRSYNTDFIGKFNFEICKRFGWNNLADITDITRPDKLKMLPGIFRQNTSSKVDVPLKDSYINEDLVERNPDKLHPYIVFDNTKTRINKDGKLITGVITINEPFSLINEQSKPTTSWLSDHAFVTAEVPLSSGINAGGGRRTRRRRSSKTRKSRKNKRFSSKKKRIYKRRNSRKKILFRKK